MAVVRVLEDLPFLGNFHKFLAEAVSFERDLGRYCGMESHYHKIQWF